MTRAEMLEMVKKLLTISHGREMVGSYNPELIAELFRAQSYSWQNLAEHHISNMADACSRFCSDLLRTICPRDNVQGQLGRIVEGSLKIRHQKAKDELTNLIKDKNRPPQTYNHYLTLTVDKKRKRRFTERKVLPEKRQKIDNGVAKPAAQTAAQSNTTFGTPAQSNSPFKIGSSAQGYNPFIHGPSIQGNSLNGTPARVDSPSGIPVPTPDLKHPTVAEDDPANDDPSIDVNGCVMDMDEYSCLDALDYLDAYYKVILHPTSTSSCTLVR